MNIRSWNNQTLGRATHLSCFCATTKCVFKEIISPHHAENIFICVCEYEGEIISEHIKIWIQNPKVLKSVLVCSFVWLVGFDCRDLL